jgi:hypothetical protein
MESARRWSGFVCPDCRFVFRVPREHDGRGVVCPSCRRILKIPSPGDPMPALVIPLPAEAAAVSGEKKHRRRNSRRGSEHDWESSDEKSPASSRRVKRQMFWMLVGGGGLFTLLVAGVLMTMLGSRQPPPMVRIPAAERPVPKAAAPADAMLTDASFLTAAEPLATKFLEAARIEDLLPLVRNPKLAEPRLRGMYPDGKIEASGIAGFNTRSEIIRQGAFISVHVRTREFLEKPMAFFASPEGLKIDWESWAGWSGMPWGAFLASKPAAGKLFRVLLSPVEYYNFAFSDDRKWQSYRLESPDGKHAIYGYVERNSPLDAMLRPAPDQTQAALTVELKFPENASSANQVLIGKMIAEGWAIQSEESP